MIKNSNFFWNRGWIWAI